MSKDFKCEACRKPSDRLHMRDSDGRWVCAHCIPDVELDARPGLRERLGLTKKSVRSASHPQRKAA